MKKKPARKIKSSRKKFSISAEEFRNKLKLKSFAAKNSLSKKHPQAVNFLNFKGMDLARIRERSAKAISSGALAGALLLSPPPTDIKYLPTPQELMEKLKINDPFYSNNEATGQFREKINRKEIVTDALQNLPEKPKNLSREEEKTLEQIFLTATEIPARATLEGEHLNTTYGYIGIEQHLRRFPGDHLGLHGDKKDQKEGMAPGLSAWGYFANSKDGMTKDLEEKEKWYAVVQTLYLPDWNTRQPYLKDWYKHRKVFIINTKNGNAVVSAIADSGPAAWTGKQFGGSPEVMQALGGDRYTKGSVIIFFVDDPDNKIPLGPVDYE
jgi:hypothetical protein